MHDTIGVILAAGAGSRFWPYNEVRNKCATSVANTPNVLRIARQLRGLGIARIVVTVGVHAGSIRHALLGLAEEGRLDFVDAGPTAGTAHGLFEAWRHTEAERALVVYGDVATDASNLARVLAALMEGAPAAALWDVAPPGAAQEWIGVRLGSEGTLKTVGHDADCEHRLSGVFALRRDILPVLEANPGLLRSVPVGGMPALEADLAQTLNDYAPGVAAVESQAPVVDMDKPWHILEANKLACADLTRALDATTVGHGASIHESAEIDGYVRLGEGSTIGRRVVVRGNLIVGAHTRIENGAIFEGHAVVGDRCRISDYCLVGSGTVIGNDCVVGHGAEVDGVMFDGAYLWHYCEISGVVGQSVDIGAATVCGTLRFDDLDATHVVKSRRERPRSGANATYFGDFSRTGVNVITQPGAKIGSYTCVGPGIVVYGDVPSRTLRLLKQETVDRPWGPERYGW